MRTTFLSLPLVVAGFGLTASAVGQAPPKVQPPKIDPPKGDAPKVPPPKIDPPKGDAPKTREAVPVDVHPAKTLPLDLTDPFRLCVSPDGQVFGVSGKEKGGGDQLTSVYFDADTGRRVGQMPQSIPGLLSDGGKLVAYVNFKPNQPCDVLVREVASGKETVVTKVETAAYPTAFSPDGKLVVTAVRNKLGCYAAADGKPVFRVNTDGQVLSLSAVFANNTRVATMHDDGVVRVWDLATGKEVDALGAKSASRGLDQLAVADDGATMTVNFSTTPVVWDLKAKKAMTWEAKSRYVLTAPDYRPLPGGRLYFPGADAAAKLKDGSLGKLSFVCLADAATGRVTHRLVVPDQLTEIPIVEASRDGKRILLLNMKPAKVYVWEVPDGRK
jgi:outer membrane protein assembly factor BamB